MNREDKEEVVLRGMWKTIEALHNSLTTTSQILERFFDITPPEHRAEAARMLDGYNRMMKSCDELIAPIREVMNRESH